MNEEDEIQPVRLIATCHTDGCPVEDVGIPNWFYPVGNFDPPRYYGGCSLCGKTYFDLRPQGEADTTEPTPAPVEVTDPGSPVEPTEPNPGTPQTAT